MITIALCVLGTMASRFIPFIVFSDKKPVPEYVKYLGKALPAAAYGMLVIYCLKDVSFSEGLHGIPELLGIAVTAGLYLWKRNMLLSIAGGTVFYMILIRIAALL